MDNTDKLTQVKYQTEELKTIMLDNITKTMERGEQLEALNDRTTILASDATVFRKSATSLKWSERLRYYRNHFLIFLIVAILVILLCWFFGAFKN